MNVFGATALRQRTPDIDSYIGDTQRQTSTDNLPEQVYAMNKKMFLTQTQQRQQTYLAYICRSEARVQTLGSTKTKVKL